MSPGRVAKRGVASACHDEEEVSCATDEIRDFKIQRRGRQQERRLKSEFAFFQSL